MARSSRLLPSAWLQVTKLQVTSYKLQRYKAADQRLQRLRDDEAHVGHDVAAEAQHEGQHAAAKQVGADHARERLRRGDQQLMNR